jgi:hypothetical protein
MLTLRGISLMEPERFSKFSGRSELMERRASSPVRRAGTLAAPQAILGFVRASFGKHQSASWNCKPLSDALAFKQVPEQHIFAQRENVSQRSGIPMKQGCGIPSHVSATGLRHLSD